MNNHLGLVKVGIVGLQYDRTTRTDWAMSAGLKTNISKSVEIKKKKDLLHQVAVDEGCDISLGGACQPEHRTQQLPDSCHPS